MRFSGLFISALLLVASSSLSLASPEALKALDTGKDGTIDLKEAQAGATKVFDTLDPDKDGTLDAKELEGRLDEAELKAADPDNDGTLDPDEYAAVVETKFKAADPDNDGTVDANELPSSAGLDLLKFISE